MILKIQRYDMQQDWWIIDNIKKMSVSRMLLKRPGCEDHAEIILFDLHNICTCTGGQEGACSDCQYYRRLICRSTDGAEFCVIFDTIAYVLNDEGKTIEKIVANYNE